MLVTRANVDSSGIVGGFPIHDAELLELECRRNESIYFRCIHPTGRTLHARFNEPGAFGIVGFRDGAILSEEFLSLCLQVQEMRTRMSHSGHGVRQVVAAYDLPPIEASEGPSLEFRVDVLQEIANQGHFGVRVWRHEVIRLQPRFSLRGSGELPPPADCNQLVEDLDEAWDRVDEDSAQAALAKVIDELRGRFGKVF